MSTTRQINVEHAIAHKINHINAGDTFISAKEIPLSRNGHLKEYFEGQISNASEDSALSAAIFDVTPANTASPAGDCLNAITDPRSFIKSSQELAKELLKAMGNDGRIKPEKSNLVICIYTQPPEPDKYLALLKLDPSEALVQKIENDPSGQPLWLNYEVRPDAMPTTREKLQKAALVLPQRCKEGYDLLLLDQQTSKEAADFFALKFLKAKPVLDEKKRTERLYNSLVKAHNRLTAVSADPQRPHLDSLQADLLLGEIGSVVNRTSIDIPAWLDCVKLPPEAKEVIQAEIKRQLPVDKKFTLDPKFAREKIWFLKNG